MKKLSKQVTVVLIVLGVSALIGGGLIYWMSGQIDEKIQQRDALMEQIGAVDKKGIFPSSANLKTLQDNLKIVRGGLNDLQALVEKNRVLFSEVRLAGADGKSFQGPEPDAWKRMFSTRREDLNKLAADNGVKLPADYDFSFRVYRSINPPREQTLDLGAQLLGVEELGRILFQAKITSLEAIKRAAPEGRKNAALSEDYVAAQLLNGVDGLYKIYPFELDFKCGTEALTHVLNQLAGSDYFFVIRDVAVESGKNTVPTRSQVRAANPGETTDASGTVLSGSTGTEPKKLLVQILGQELINVRIRVDLICWQPAAGQSKK